MSHAVKATRRHRKPLLVAAAFVVVVAGLGLWWFQPYKLLIDDKVDEALPAMPTVPGAGGGGAGAGAQPATPPVVARGTVI
ncbi:MAG: hypothetical protein ACRDY5_07070, partial [Acidimicrobiales bacterium]